MATQRIAAQQKREAPTEERHEEPSKRINVTPSQTKKNLKEKKRDVAVQRRTVFVNNLPFTATESDLQTLFTPYGSITSINVVRNNHGKSRGFAYVEFEEEKAARDAIEQNGKEMQHRKLEVKLSVPQDERKVEKKEPHPTVSATIYVSGLPTGVSEYEFSVFFSKCGKVTDSRVIRDKITKVGKGTGLLQFADDASVENALRMDGETWKDHKIHVQRSKFAVKS